MGLFHIYNKFIPIDSRRRHCVELAAKSWDKHFYKQGVYQVGIGEIDLNRTSKIIGDNRNMPFAKDLIDFGYRSIKSTRDKSNSIIIFTNSDVCATEHTLYFILEGLKLNNAIYSHRYEVEKVDKLLNSKEIINNQRHWGADLFAFKYSWWEKIRDYFPDLLLGCEYWDEVMMDIIDLTEYKPSIDSMIYHEKHEGFWQQGKNREENPGQIHNIKIAMPYLNKLKVLKFLKVNSKYVPAVNLLSRQHGNIFEAFKFGFNVDKI